MSVQWPEGLRLERLRRGHARAVFSSGEPQVDEWLATFALQQQRKHLSSTKVLLTDKDDIIGYYTLATGQADFSDLPVDLARRLPKRALPIAILAWLAVDARHQGQGWGARLLAQALSDCYVAGKTFAFVAVILDCLNDDAKRFYRRWDFAELPGHPYRLFLSAVSLAAMMDDR